MLSFEKNTDDGDDVLVFQEKLERMNSGNNLDGSSPRKVLLEQLQRILPADDSLPDQVMNSSLITDSSVHNVYLSISLCHFLNQL